MNRSSFRKFLKTLTAGVDYQYVQLPDSDPGKRELVLSKEALIKMAAASRSPRALDLVLAVNQRFPR